MGDAEQWRCGNAIPLRGTRNIWRTCWILTPCRHSGSQSISDAVNTMLELGGTTGVPPVEARLILPGFVSA